MHVFSPSCARVLLTAFFLLPACRRQSSMQLQTYLKYGAAQTALQQLGLYRALDGTVSTQASFCQDCSLTVTVSCHCMLRMPCSHFGD